MRALPASPRRIARAVLLEPGEECRRRRSGRISPLRHSRRRSPARQGFERGDVGQHQSRLVKGCRPGSCRGGVSMPVLPPTELSTWASRVVGICTKSMPRSTMRRGKAGEIADHAAAQGDQSRRRSTAASSRRSTTSCRCANPWSLRRAAARFLVAMPRAVERGSQGGQVQLRDLLVGDDEDARPAPDGRDQRPASPDSPRPREYRSCARRVTDADGPARSWCGLAHLGRALLSLGGEEVARAPR